MASVISLVIPHIAGQSQINAVVLNGTTYPAPSPFIFEEANAPAIESWLNGLGLGTFGVTYQTIGTISYLEIRGECDTIFDNALQNYISGQGDIAFTIPFSFEPCTDSSCLVENCIYTAKIPVCDYAIDFSGLESYTTEINTYGATISVIEVLDINGDPINILSGYPAVYAGNYALLEMAIVFQLLAYGFGPTNGFPNYSVTNSFYRWNRIRITIPIPLPNPSITLTFDFVQSNCHNEDVGNVTGLLGPGNLNYHTITLDPWEVNGNPVNFPPVNINTVAQLISEIGDASYNPWTYAAPVLSVSSPYSHREINSISTYNTNNDNLSRYVVYLYLIKGACESTEQVNIRGALTIDCAQKNCLLFRDATGAYNELTNPKGYGSPNFPSFTTVSNTVFEIKDSGGTLLYTNDYGYMPSADETEMCLDISTYNLLHGTAYILAYTVYADNGAKLECLEIPFTLPCCGAQLPTDLVVKAMAMQQYDCTQGIVIVDTTGVYSATNLSGYCGPNPCYSNIERVEILITLPDGSQVLITRPAVTANKNTIGILPEELGGYTTLPDGVYRLEYRVWGTNLCLLGTVEFSTVLYCNLLACLTEKGAELLGGCAPCKDEEGTVDRWIKMRLELEEIIAASTENIKCVEGKVEELLKECQKDCAKC